MTPKELAERIRSGERFQLAGDARSDSHTPGPWILATSNSWRRFLSRREGWSVCEPIKQNDGHPDLYFRNGGEQGPDARLIEAAPDLLKACIQAIVALKGREHDGFLREAISKATGSRP